MTVYPKPIGRVSNCLHLCPVTVNSNATDLLNLASKLTFRRTVNFLRILFSYYVSRIAGRPLMSGLPVSASVEPTTSCNLRCPECPSGLRAFTRPTGMLKEELYDGFIEQSHKHLLYLVFYFQGEPYLHPRFTELIGKAAKKNIYTSTSTNAHFITEEKAEETVRSGLDRLIISIDGTTQEVYEQYRIGGNLDKVLEGTERIIRWKKKLKSRTPYVVFQFLVVGPNEHQVPMIRKLAKEMGVDKVVFKTAQIADYENGNPLIPSAKYSRYEQSEDGRYVPKNKLPDHCWKLWHACVMTWDGRIIPCCFDKDAAHTMGYLADKPLASIWKNENYYNFRKSVLKSRKEIDICTNCSEGTTVWA